MHWTKADFVEILEEMRARRGDTTTVEVKRASKQLPQLSDTICAFANMPTGGSIILGVDEASGQFIPTGVSDLAKYEAGLASTTRNAVKPEPLIEFQTFTLDGKDILVAHVAPLRTVDKPATTGGFAYLRQSDGDYKMAEHELRMLEVAKLQFPDSSEFDTLAVKGLSSADLDHDLVQAYLAQTRQSVRRLRDFDDAHILRATSVIAGSGAPTIAGLYTLGAYPQGRYPALTVTAAVQLRGGENQARNRNLRDFSGPIPVLLEEALEWVRVNLDTVSAYREDGNMQTIPELPLPAIRELIANALVHRDLSPQTLGTGKQIQIRLTPHRLFIQSPGGLRGVSLEQLRSVEHSQAAVNQRVYQIAKRLRTSDNASVIEGEGGGLAEVLREVRKRNLPTPLLTDTGVQFTATLWRPENRDQPAPFAAAETTLHSVEVDNFRRDSLASSTVSDSRPADTTSGSTAAVSSSPAPTETRHGSQVIAVLQSHPEGLRIKELSDITGLKVAQLRWTLRALILSGNVEMQGGQGHKSTRYIPRLS